MIVDDHASFRQILREFLPPETARVLECQDGAEAVQAYPAEHPDCVLMDLAMPVMDGLQATAAILQHDPTARILIVSNHDDETTRRSIMETGASGFLSKSQLSDLPTLLDRLR